MTLRNISCGPLGFRHKPSHNSIISEYQPATSTGCYKRSLLGESLYSLLSSRTEENDTHHSAAQFSNFFFLEGAGYDRWGLELYFSNFMFSTVFFGTTGNSHVDNGCQIRDSLRNRYLAFIQRTYLVQAVAELPPHSATAAFPHPESPNTT